MISRKFKENKLQKKYDYTIKRLIQEVENSNF